MPILNSHGKCICYHEQKVSVVNVVISHIKPIVHLVDIISGVVQQSSFNILSHLSNFHIAFKVFVGLRIFVPVKVSLKIDIHIVVYEFFDGVDDTR